MPAVIISHATWASPEHELAILHRYQPFASKEHPRNFRGEPPQAAGLSGISGPTHLPIVEKRDQRNEMNQLLYAVILDRIISGWLLYTQPCTSSMHTVRVHRPCTPCVYTVHAHRLNPIRECGSREGLHQRNCRARCFRHRKI